MDLAQLSSPASVLELNRLNHVLNFIDFISFQGGKIAPTNLSDLNSFLDVFSKNSSYLPVSSIHVVSFLT